MAVGGRWTLPRVAISFGTYEKVQKLSEEGKLKEALHLVELMTRQSSEAPKGAFVCLLRACSKRKALEVGKQLHSLIAQTKYDQHIFLSNLLVDMYSNCGSLVDAVKIFAAMPCRNVFSWTVMISAYVSSGCRREALALFQQMQEVGVEPNKVTFVVTLKACADIATLKQGREIHALIRKKGIESDMVIQTSLIDMYGRCGSLKDAHELFDEMPARDVISWNAMLMAYARKGFGKECFDLYDRMKREGMVPNKVTFVLLLKACAGISSLEQGRQLHSLIVERGLKWDNAIQTTLIDMYAKCGCLDDARELFSNMLQRNVVSWNVMIAGYAHKGLGQEALDLYEQMKHEDMEPDNVTLVLLLKACSSISDGEQGRWFHSLILEKGLESDMTIQTALVDMYSKCGCLKDAHELFNKMTTRDVVSWNAMIGCYSQKGFGKEALDICKQMKDEGLEPNEVTFVLLLKACASIMAIEQGRLLHSLILEKGLESEMAIQNSLVDMYAKCGRLNDARELFNNMRQRDMVSWNAMIAGYVQEGLGQDSLDIYEQMKHEDMEPDNITLVLLLKACARISALESGRQLHSLILEKGLDSEVAIQNSLVGMYAKCGCLQYARELFTNIRRRDMFSWNAMIAGYAQEGFGEEALDLYKQMKHEGMEPDNITLVLLLKACAGISALAQGRQLHSLILEKRLDLDMVIQTTLLDLYSKCGCPKDARELFDKMNRRDVVAWNVMISGYGQEGLGEEALNLYEQMIREGLQANEATYTSVLSACSHSNLVDEGRHVFESMLKDHGVTPTLEHYGCMVDILGRAGFVADAEDFILKMPIEADEAVWMSLLGAARKYVNPDVGRRAFERIVELNQEGAAPYLLLIDIYLAADRMDEVVHIRKEMQHRGLEKNQGNL